MADPLDLDRFLRGEVEPRGFSHREHLRMAFELLALRDFASAVADYSHALRALLARAGKPAAFHQTITIAWLSLVAERRERFAQTSFERFSALNSDLLESSLLNRWYAAEQLDCELARRIFVLPAQQR